jgi:hypothetical protein
MSKGNTLWGLFLLIVGLAFLGDSLGYINVSFGLIWPLALILLGVFILFGRQLGAEERQQVTVQLEGATEGLIRIEHGAGRLEITGPAKGGEMLSGEFSHMDLSSKRDGEKLKLHLHTEANFGWLVGGNQEWKFGLSPEIPLSIDIDGGASDNVLDLRKLNVKRLDIDTGASSTKVHLPENAGQTVVDIDSGASSLDMIVPTGVAADIRVDSGLSSISVDETRFPRSGNRYTSRDYASATNRVDISIDTGVSSVTIK